MCGGTCIREGLKNNADSVAQSDAVVVSQPGESFPTSHARIGACTPLPCVRMSYTTPSRTIPRAGAPPSVPSSPSIDRLNRVLALVTEHEAHVREQDVKIAELARQVADLTSAFRQEMDALAPARGLDVRSELDAARKALGQLHAQVQLVAKEHEDTQSSIAAVRDEMSRATKRQEDAGSSAAQLRAWVSDQLAAAARERDQDGRMEEVLGQLDSLGVAVADQAAGLEATRSRVMDMAEQMSAGRRVATAAGERAEEAGARAQEAVARADGVAARVDEAERRLELALRALGALERAAADAGGQASAAWDEAREGREEAREATAALRRELQQHVSERVAAVKQAVAAHVGEQVTALQAAVAAEVKGAQDRADRARRAAERAERQWAERLAGAVTRLREEGAEAAAQGAREAQEVAEAVGTSVRGEVADMLGQLAQHVRAARDEAAGAERRAEAAEMRAREAAAAAEAAGEAAGKLRVEREESALAALRALEARVAGLEGQVVQAGVRGTRAEGAVSPTKELSRQVRALQRERESRAREVEGLRAHFGRMGRCLEERSRDLADMADTLAGLAREVFRRHGTQRGAGIAASPLLQALEARRSEEARDRERRAADESIAQFDAFMARMKRRLREAEHEARELRKLAGEA